MEGKQNSAVTLTLRRKTWANLFHVLHELGLPQQCPNRVDVYRREYGTHFSAGNFWAAVQYLESQFEKQTGLASQRDYVEEITSCNGHP